jgi:hypothetical protein
MFWFILAVVFLILWLNDRSKLDRQKDSYGRGYENGRRDILEQLKSCFKDGKADVHTIKNIAFGLNAKDTSKDDQMPTPSVHPSLNLNVVQDDHQPHSQKPTASVMPESVALPDGYTAVYDTPIKQDNTLRNLNTMLYLASFLLVAAAAIFVATSTSASVRLLGLMGVTALFYFTGIYLYKKVEKLKPAAIAFVGTGIAILPFIGLALVTIGNLPTGIAWLITSIIGVIAYGYAALILQSQLVSFLTIGFVITLAYSAVDSASLAIVWFFVSLSLVSLSASLVSYIKPSWMPEVFKIPVEKTGQFVTPTALVASLLVVDQMSIQSYELLFGVVTAQYFVTWLQQRSLFFETVVRVMVHATLLLVAYDITDGNIGQFGYWWTGLALVQFAFSYVRSRSASETILENEQKWTVAVLSLLVVGISFWSDSTAAASLTTLSIACVGILGTLSAKIFKQAAWLYVTTLAVMVEPFIVGRWLLEPAAPWIALVITLGLSAFLFVGLYGMAIRSINFGIEGFMNFAYNSSILLIGTTLFAGLVSWEQNTVASAFAFASIFSFVLSYVSRGYELELLAIGAGFIAAATWLELLLPEDSPWWLFIATTIYASMLLLLTTVHHFIERNSKRRNISMGSMLAVLLVLIYPIVAEGPEVRNVSTLILAVASVGLIAFRWWKGSSISSQVQTIFATGYLSYVIALGITAFTHDLGVTFIVLGFVATMFWVTSYVEKFVELYIVGHIVFFIAAVVGWNWRFDTSDWLFLQVAWITSLVFLIHYSLNYFQKDEKRLWFSIGAIWTSLSIGILSEITSNDSLLGTSSALTVVGLALSIALHGYVVKQKNMIEAAVYIATLGLQRSVGINFQDIPIIYYAYWWSAVIAVVALWRKESIAERMIVAASIITLVSAYEALTKGGGYQLLFLIEHVVLLAAGVIFRAQWAVWWGVAASVAAVMYFIKDYVYLWLALLGLSLIGLAVWRLLQIGKNK